MKKLRTIYPYDLTERTKNSNLEHPTSKLFPPLPRFGDRRENLSINQTNLRQLTPYQLTEEFPPRNKSENFRRILEGRKGKDLRKLASNVTNDLKTYDDTKKKDGVSQLLIFFE